ncbi:MAG: glucosaminidase domain-containing protein, partial [Tannerella sp.]|nr:glucosaminidase domain-containing protein [Tannerella sp.]
TGNILVDYTLFGFEDTVVHEPEESTKSIKSTEKEPAEPEPKEDSPEVSGVSSFISQIYPAAKRLYETAEGLHPLFVTAQAALETGWKIKKTGNNIFGITKGSWTGATNLLLTTEILDTPDKQFTLPEKIVSVEPLASGKYRYSVYRLFRAYASIDECIEDHFTLLKGSLYKYAWEYRNDPREYARQIAPVYATSPDYANTLVAVIEMVERNVREYENLKIS